MAGNWLGLAGGAAEGVLAGMQDNRQRELYEFYKRQQQRQEQQQKIEDTAEAAYRAVPAAGEYEREVRAPDEQTMMGPSPRKETAKFTPAQRAKAQIEALSRGTGAQRRDASTLQQQLNQQEEYEYQKHQRTVFDTAMKASMLAESNPEAAFKLLGEGYDNFPDGQKMVVQKGPDGKSYYGVADQSGRFVKGYEPKLITADEARKMAGTALQFASQDMYKFMKDNAVKERGVGAQERTAGAAERGAATTEAWREYMSTGLGGQSQRELERKHGNYWDRAGAAAGKAAPHQILGQTDEGELASVSYGKDGQPVLHITALPKDKDGKPMGLFPKVTGAKTGGAAKYDIKPNPEGTGFVAFDKGTGAPAYNVDSFGQAMPLGIQPQEFYKERALAKSKGVTFDYGPNKDGKLMLVYKKGDEVFDNLKEAVEYKPPKPGKEKKEDKTEDTVSSRRGEANKAADKAREQARAAQRDKDEEELRLGLSR